MKLCSIAQAVFSLLLLVGCNPNKRGVDMILYNGRVWTGIDTVSFVEAVAVEGNVISATGSTDRIFRLAGRNTQLIDLKGKLVTPGFNDAHIHFLSGSIGLTEVDLTEAASIKDVVRIIKKFASDNPDKKWITGRGWQYTMFNGGLPSKQILDTAINDRLVFIKAYDGHSAWANSAALRAAKINKASVSNHFGEIVKDKNGEPTGVFKEEAMSAVSDFIPPLTKEERLNALRKGLSLAKSLGITSMANASGSPEELELYQELLRDSALSVRMAAAFSANAATTENDIKLYKDLKDRQGKNPMLTASAIKFMLDGVIESHTAVMLEPYSNLTPGELSPTGSFALPLENYRKLVADFDKLGFSIYTHAIGDRAVRESLNAYENAAKVNGTSSRHRVEHIETISPVDIPRFAALGVLPSMEPIHAEPGTVSVWAEGVGEKRLPNSFAWASILAAKGNLVFSSDWPACVSLNPIRGLHTAVTRKTTKGYPEKGWVPGQKITMQQALIAYTQGGAYSSFEENSKGRIAPGYLADMVILSQDLFSIDPVKTYETKVLTTIFDGKVIYDVRN
jgi:predicted amidohydrolase YtcJ